MSTVFNELSFWSGLFEELAISLTYFSIVIQIILSCCDIYFFILWNNTHFPSVPIFLPYQPRAKAFTISHCVSLCCSLPITPVILSCHFQTRITLFFCCCYFSLNCLQWYILYTASKQTELRNYHISINLKTHYLIILAQKKKREPKN